MGSVYIDVNGIVQGGYLYEFYHISRKASEFEQFNGEGIRRKLPDYPFFASFEVCDGKAQTYLDRL